MKVTKASCDPVARQASRAESLKKAEKATPIQQLAAAHPGIALAAGTMAGATLAAGLCSFGGPGLAVGCAFVGAATGATAARAAGYSGSKEGSTARVGDANRAADEFEQSCKRQGSSVGEKK